MQWNTCIMKLEQRRSPIILFVYRRIPENTIKSLLLNDIVQESELFIFSDGYKNNMDKNDVLEVRKYLKSIKGFKSINITETSKNKGLANSIISGVTQVLNEYERVIVLEDDLVVSKDFLEYMNNALEFYKDDLKIWSISGYGPKLRFIEKEDKDIYLSQRGSSWGWATWKDRWETIDWDVKDFNKLKKDIVLRKNFELGGNDLYKMLELQILGKIDSWAVRWVFSQFIQKRFTVYPKISKIINDGFSDGKGTHNSGNNDKWTTELNHNNIKFKALELDEDIIKEFKKYHDLSLYTKVGYLLKKYGGYDFIKKVLIK